MPDKHFTELYSWLFNDFRSYKIPGVPREPIHISTSRLHERIAAERVMYVQTGATLCPRPPLLEPPGFLLDHRTPGQPRRPPTQSDDGDSVDVDVWGLLR